MLPYRICSRNALSTGVTHGYTIRAFVAASRAELKAGSGAIVSNRKPWIRHSSSTSAFKPSSTSETLSPDTEGTETTSTPPTLATETSSSIPWYFQIAQTGNDSATPSSALQQLPPTIASAPPIYTPLFEYLSIDLGLDDISLLDLRTLDPPAALGANLLMLFGTARSEKHLHVSADRLCRWLRTEHRLSPFADGLLGRNELKLRMKRKAKRTRLLNSVGVRSAREQDGEEIRNGWVCVNLGLVDGGELGSMAVEEDVTGGFIGFKSEEKGCRIVVQMMTDEKRGHLDLESLWTGIKNRAAAAAVESE